MKNKFIQTRVGKPSSNEFLKVEKGLLIDTLPFIVTQGEHKEPVNIQDWIMRKLFLFTWTVDFRRSKEVRKTTHSADGPIQGQRSVAGGKQSWSLLDDSY
jgi:hypothetical protein